MLYQTVNPHGGDIYQGEVLLDFSANTNPFGTPEGVLAALREALPQVSRYPDPYCRALVKAIAAFEKVAPEHILCGNGAAELIYGYCRAAGVKKGAELAPTFSEYTLGLYQAGGEMVRYPLSREGGFLPGPDFLAFLEKETPDTLFLCHPNNPTGLALPKKEMEAIFTFCRDRGIRLFVDECFLDLTTGAESFLPWLEEYPGLFILKAFTKSYGMAGIRLGYCLTADRDLLAGMAQGVQPWNVSSLAQAAGVAALREQAFLEKTRQLAAQQRQYLTRALEALGFWVCPSQANFLLFQGRPGLDAALKQEKILIRSCANYQGLGPGWYRIAVRRREENDRLVSAIASIAGGQGQWQKT